MTPQNRVMLSLTKGEFTVGIVERWKGGREFMVRADLFGFADLLAVAPYKGDAFLIQVTTVDNIASRVKKILEECFVRANAWLSQTRRIIVVGVRKRKLKDRKNAKYSLKVLEIKGGDEKDSNLHVEVMLDGKGESEIDSRDLPQVLWIGKTNHSEGE